MYSNVYVCITVYLFVNVTSLLVSRAPLAQAPAYRTSKGHWRETCIF